MDACTSSAVVAGITTRFTITEWPETPVATPFALNFASTKLFLIVSAMGRKSIMAPSTTASADIGSQARPESWKAFLILVNSTAFHEREPISELTRRVLLFKAARDR